MLARAAGDFLLLASPRTAHRSGQLNWRPFSSGRIRPLSRSAGLSTAFAALYAVAAGGLNDFDHFRRRAAQPRTMRQWLAQRRQFGQLALGPTPAVPAGAGHAVGLPS